jgi:hypothetical protein
LRGILIQVIIALVFSLTFSHPGHPASTFPLNLKLELVAPFSFGFTWRFTGEVPVKKAYYRTVPSNFRFFIVVSENGKIFKCNNFSWASDAGLDTECYSQRDPIWSEIHPETVYSADLWGGAVPKKPFPNDGHYFALLVLKVIYDGKVYYVCSNPLTFSVIGQKIPDYRKIEKQEIPLKAKESIQAELNEMVSLEGIQAKDVSW